MLLVQRLSVYRNIIAIFRAQPKRRKERVLERIENSKIFKNKKKKLENEKKVFA